MLETLVDVAGILPLAILSGFLLVAFSVGLWYVKKTTGRPMRDMLAVLAGAITLILLMVLPMRFFWGQINSPDRSTRKLTERILVALYMLVAVGITWAFNKLAKGRSRRKKHQPEKNQLAEKANSPYPRPQP